MKKITYLTLGLLFGIILSKSEVISWYRIYEMFRFQSFHMYGVIGSSVVTGVVAIQFLKRFNVKTIEGVPIVIDPKKPHFVGALIGGTIFGLGWVLTGSCPGPMFILMGNGLPVFSVVIISALLGTYVYGLIRNKLPH